MHCLGALALFTTCCFDKWRIMIQLAYGLLKGTSHFDLVSMSIAWSPGKRVNTKVTLTFLMMIASFKPTFQRWLLQNLSEEASSVKSWNMHLLVAVWSKIRLSLRLLTLSIVLWWEIYQRSLLIWTHYDWLRCQRLQWTPLGDKGVQLSFLVH